MSVRQTSTGRVLEAMVMPSLAAGGYQCDQQVVVGVRPNGRKHVADVVATRAEQSMIISLKWQQVSGTAEQKVPFEVMCLRDAIVDPATLYQKAYLVLGGEGWTLREFFTSDVFKRYIDLQQVCVLTLEAFIAKANRGVL